MVKVVWTQRALTDLEDIGDYISRDSNKADKNRPVWLNLLYKSDIVRLIN